VNHIQIQGGRILTMIIYKGTKTDAYLPAIVLPAYVDLAYEERGVRTPFGIFDQLIIQFMTGYLGKTKLIKENYILPFTDTNKAGLAIKSLMGHIPEQLDPSDLFDLDCYIRIEHRSLKNGGTWVGVQEVFPFENEQIADNHDEVPESIPPDPETHDIDSHLRYNEAPESIPPDPETHDIDSHLRYDEAPESIPPDADDILSANDMWECIYDDDEHQGQYRNNIESDLSYFHDHSNGIRYEDEEPPIDEDDGRYWPTNDYDVEF
jgi:hypothetical protein